MGDSAPLREAEAVQALSLIHIYTAVINMEKFDRHSGPVMRRLPGVEGEHPVIECGAGCVTRRIEEAAAAAGLVFAVDPRCV